MLPGVSDPLQCSIRHSWIKPLMCLGSASNSKPLLVHRMVRSETWIPSDVRLRVQQVLTLIPIGGLIQLGTLQETTRGQCK